MVTKAKNYPSVTVFMISYNDQEIITDCLKSIRNQNYPGITRILMVDGGSTDKTLAIAKKYHAEVVSRPDLKNKPDLRGEIAVQSIKTEIALALSADNRFQERSSLRKMIEPFFDDEIVAVETFHYGFRKKDSLLTKYFALIGGGDPVAVALGKADRAPYDKDKWHSFGKVDNKKNYFKVVFDNNMNKIPTLGANGFAIRASLLKEFPCKDNLHIEMCVNLIDAKYNKFAFVRNAHVIHIVNGSLIMYLKRKLSWLTTYSNRYIKRKYLVFNPGEDIIKMVLIIISFSTFVFPFIRALKGYIKYKNSAWFLHPMICFIFLINYGFAMIQNFFNKKNI